MRNKDVPERGRCLVTAAITLQAAPSGARGVRLRTSGNRGLTSLLRAGPETGHRRHSPGRDWQPALGGKGGTGRLGRLGGQAGPAGVLRAWRTQEPGGKRRAPPMRLHSAVAFCSLTFRGNAHFQICTQRCWSYQEHHEHLSAGARHLPLPLGLLLLPTIGLKNVFTVGKTQLDTYWIRLSP